MKVVVKPIAMVSWTTEQGDVHPVRFRLQEGEKKKVIHVDKVIEVKKERIAGNYVHMFTCRSKIDNEDKLYELRYEASYCRWTLFKI